MATPAEALDAALANLQTLEREHGDSAAALDGRRARHREASARLEDLHRKVKASDPDAEDFAKLSAERSTARDREEALRAQLARAEGEHKALGDRVKGARAAHESATRAEAMARIQESSAHLSKRLRLFIGQFAPEVAAHFAAVVKENEVRGTRDPFTVWGEGSPDPATIGFWNMVAKAFLESLPAGSAERARTEQSMRLTGQMQATVRNTPSVGASNSSPALPSSSAGTVGYAARG